MADLWNSLFNTMRSRMFVGWLIRVIELDRNSSGVAFDIWTENSNKYFQRRRGRRGSHTPGQMLRTFTIATDARGASVFVSWSERMAAVRSVTLTNCNVFSSLGFVLLFFFAPSPRASPFCNDCLIGKRILRFTSIRICKCGCSTRAISMRFIFKQLLV